MRKIQLALLALGPEVISVNTNGAIRCLIAPRRVKDTTETPQGLHTSIVKDSVDGFAPRLRSHPRAAQGLKQPPFRTSHTRMHLVCLPCLFGLEAARLTNARTTINGGVP